MSYSKPQSSREEQSKQQDRFVKKGIMSIRQWHSAGQDTPGHKKRQQKPQGQRQEGHGARAYGAPGVCEIFTGNSRKSLCLCSYVVLPIGWGGGSEKGGLLCSDGVILYFDRGGGYTDLYLGENCTELHIHTYTNVCKNQRKRMGSGIQSTDCTNVSFPVVTLYHSYTTCHHWGKLAKHPRLD